MADQDEPANTIERTPLQKKEDLLRQAIDLQGSINAFLKQVEVAQPLPSYPAMFARLMALRDAVSSFSSKAREYNDLLSTAVIVPTGQCPARYHMDVMQMLLRTKMEPGVEDWEHQHLKSAHERERRLDLEKKRGSLTSLTEADRTELWDWAAEATQNELKKHVWFAADYTMAEVEDGIENVNHGLRRKLIVPEPKDEEDDEDELFEDVDEDNQDDMDVDSVQPEAGDPVTAVSTITHKPIAMDKLHRFMTRGEAV